VRLATISKGEFHHAGRDIDIFQQLSRRSKIGMRLEADTTRIGDKEKSYAKPDYLIWRANRLYSQAFERLFRLGAAASKPCLRTRALSLYS
jgi:hypothetical protein